MSYTPGPWFTGHIDSAMSENFMQPCVASPSRELAIAIIPVDDNESEDNLNLIAAAPDLLACVKVWLEQMRQEMAPATSVHVLMAEAAIAKAEGEKA